MKKLSTALIIIGLIVLFSPLAGQWYTGYRQEQLFEQWMNSGDAVAAEAVVASASEAADAAAAEANSNEAGFCASVQGEKPGNDALQESEMHQGSESHQGNETNQGSEPHQESEKHQESKAQQGDGAKQKNKATKPKAGQAAAEQTVLGTIRIDKIKVKSIIVEGVKPDNLRTGIGHMPGTTLPGQPGNCVLTGHRSYTFGRFFNRLDELEIGDAIVLSDKKADYTYIVFERSEVLPTDLSILESNNEESIATLITCTPIYIASHRLVIKARLDGTALKES